MWQPGNTFLTLGAPSARAVRTLLIVTVGVFVVQWIVDVDTGRSFSMIFGLSRRGLREGRIWGAAFR
jgi:hypothetical protein